jgi:transposase
MRVQKLSIPLDLPEFEIINEWIEENRHVAEVKKDSNHERCPYCGFVSNRIHDRRSRFVRDLLVLDKPLYLKVNIVRFRCMNCKEVFSQSFDSINPNQHQTVRFREFLYNQCYSSTIQQVSRRLNIPYSTVERIYYSVAREKAIEHQTQLRRQAAIGDEVTIIGIDEIAIRKNHIYETVLVDLQHGGVIGMTHHRTFESTVQLLKFHSVLSVANVKTIVLDMWEPFHKAIKALFPKVTVVIDKYHVVQKVNQALDQVRKELQPNLIKKLNPFKKGRFLLLKRFEDLNEDQLLRLNKLLDQSFELTKAYYLKESFRDIYMGSDPVMARKRMISWIQEAQSTGFKPFQEVAKTIHKWLDPILCYFDLKYTNARTEGTNHKIKNIKRRAYGYRNVDRFRLRVMLECTGKVKQRPFINWLDQIC